MKIKTIASGSKGNCSFVIAEETKLIIDAGISYLALRKSLEDNFLSLKDFSGILITHCHSDHTKGLSSIINKTNLKVYIPEDMYMELKGILPLDRCIFIGDNEEINEINLELIHTSHDTNCSVGYIFEHNNKKIVYVTDTGYINRKYLSKMKNADVYVIESNHDERMLMDGSYPYFLKQRVISDKGHLSNETTAKYLKKIIDENTKYVVLAHLSEQNNTEELAYNATKKILREDIELIIARQKEESELIEV